jgi:hypothetical protein
LATKTDFSVEEWQQLILAPQIASMVVMLASPSGPVGAIKELVAASKLLVEAIQTNTGNALIDAVAADLKEMVEKKEKLPPPALSKDPNEARSQCLQACRDLAALLDQKAPDDAEGYKQWVYQAARRTSEASKEGGFLGIGGVRVSEAEVAALKQVAEALGIEAV